MNEMQAAFSIMNPLKRWEEICQVIDPMCQRRLRTVSIKYIKGVLDRFDREHTLLTGEEVIRECPAWWYEVDDDKVVYTHAGALASTHVRVGLDLVQRTSLNASLVAYTKGRSFVIPQPAYQPIQTVK
jgi:hypothetical protein